MLTQFLAPLKQQFHANHNESVSDRLHESADFQKMLQRERSRIDRNGGNLCIVTFNKGDIAAQRISLQQVGQALSARLRLTDFSGWLDHRTLAVALPFTNSQSARRVAKDLAHSLAAGKTTLPYSISSYPAEKLAGEEHSTARPVRNGERAVHAAATFFHQPLPLWKRAIDIMGAGVGLIALAPLMLFIAVMVRISSPGPILFRQLRGGQGGKPFIMLKFRSMVIDAEERKQHLMDQNEQDGPAFKITHDPRVTKIGKFLRGTSMDELPQLWNVLKGEMSLVGPRPLPVAECQACLPWHKRRLDVTPGITCFWQCMSGRRVSFDEWMRLDIRYVRQRSLKLDLSLIFKTVFAVVSHKALKHNGEETRLTASEATMGQVLDRQKATLAS